ncbi:MAG: 6-carboxytetrahydropterin synthase [Verrucomicrobia bacterium]|nr:6-carboxytetrahydropterin synthase [Verrucomicrobiota bacterium]
MPYRICTSIEVESGHMLSKHPGLCKYPHGHSRRVELIVEAGQLNAHEMVCDFKVLKDALNDTLRAFDHALCVNTRDPNFGPLKAAFGERIVAFEAQDPTTEILARAIFDALNQRLAADAAHPRAQYPFAPGTRIVRVRVWETSHSWAEYSEG